MLTHLWTFHYPLEFILLTIDQFVDSLRHFVSKPIIIQYTNKIICKLIPNLTTSIEINY